MAKKSRRKSPNKKSKKRSKCSQFSKLMCNNRSKKTRGCVWRKNSGCVRKSRRRSGARSVRKSRGRKSRGRRRSVRKSRGRRRSRRSSRRRSTRRKSGSRHRGTKSPPNGIITKAWIKKACPCRDGDNCIPCPGDLKKYKDGRKYKYDYNLCYDGNFCNEKRGSTFMTYECKDGKDKTTCGQYRKKYTLDERKAKKDANSYVKRYDCGSGGKPTVLNQLRNEKDDNIKKEFCKQVRCSTIGTDDFCGDTFQ